MDANWSDVEKSLDEAVKKVPEHAREEAKRHGTPIYTEDDTGVVIKEYPDGRKVGKAIYLSTDMPLWAKHAIDNLL